MAKYPKTARLSGGDEITIRPLEKTDHAALVSFFSQVSEEDRRYLKEDVTDAQVIQRWIDNIDFDRILPLLALSGDQVVGDATLHCNPFGWSRHVAEIRVVIAQKWQRKGVGGALIDELVGRAHERGIEILEAHVLEGQHGAQRALEALGFQVETVLRGRATDRTDRRRNIMVMTNDVSEMWRKMEELLQDTGPYSGRY